MPVDKLYSLNQVQTPKNVGPDLDLNCPSRFSMLFASVTIWPVELNFTWFAGSAVVSGKYLTQGGGAAGSSLTSVTVLCP